MKAKAKKLGLIAGIFVLAVLIVIGLKMQFKKEAPPDLTQLLKEEPVKMVKQQEVKPSEEQQIQVKQEKAQPREIAKIIEVKQKEEEPLFIQRLKASGVEVKEYKEMQAMGKLMNEYYKNQGYPRLEREFNAQVPEGKGTGEIIVKEVNWNDDGSYNVRYYTVKVGDGQESTAIDALKDESSVVTAEPNLKIRIQSAVNIYTDNPSDNNSPDKEYDPFFEKQWGLKAIKAPQAWEYTEGSKDIKIAILDSGIDLGHPDLIDNVDLSLSCDYIRDDNEPEDEHPQSHGTHIAGIIAGVGFNGIGIHGVMNKATLIIHKILIGDETEVPIISLASTISQAIVKGARVINMSWVTETDLMAESAILKDIFQQAFANDKLVLVAAAGNKGKVLYPAKYSEVLSVGGVDQDGNVYGFEGGKKKGSQLEEYLKEVDILAPGVDIYSTMVRKNDGSDEDGYGYLSGTSQAAAFVSGVIGLLLAKNPDLTRDEIIQRITENTDEVEGLNKGMINTQKAIEAVRSSGGGGGEFEAVAYVGEKGKKEITVNVGEEVQFYGDESIPPEGYELSDLNFQWDFGDGETSDEINPTHIYQEAGNYTVILVVSLGEDSSSDSVTVNVEEAGSEGNQPPVINAINYEPQEPKPGEEITFTADASDPDGQITKYEWNFGDGNTAEGEEVRHTYENEGTYTVKLTVTDDKGETAEKTVDVEVKEEEEKPPLNEYWIKGTLKSFGEPVKDGSVSLIAHWKKIGPWGEARRVKEKGSTLITTVQTREDGSYKIVVPDHVINLLPGELDYMEVKTGSVIIKNTAYIGRGDYVAELERKIYYRTRSGQKRKWNNERARKAEKELNKIKEGIIQLVEFKDNVAEVNFDFPPKDSILVIASKKVSYTTGNEIYNRSAVADSLRIDIGFSPEPDWRYDDKDFSLNEIQYKKDGKTIRGYKHEKKLTVYAVFKKETLGELPRPIEMHVLTKVRQEKNEYYRTLWIEELNKIYGNKKIK